MSDDRLSVGVDVGGTFTDLVAVHADGRVVARKVSSTPADQSEGVERALRELRDGGIAGERIERIVHGTTVATNALLERTGARVALCATAGATDVLTLRRQDRAALYDLSAEHPAPLAPAELVVGVAERVEPQGVTRPLTERGVADAVAAVRALAPDAVAIALLHGYADGTHEELLASALAAALPDTPVVRSSAVFPEIREYERTATTVAEAYLRPTVANYLDRLSSRVTALGMPAPAVMTSSGGMRTAAEAAASAAALALSGPAGGVVGAAAVLRAAGLGDALTIDIGGTSADVGLVLGGTPLVEPGGAIAGVPIALPRVLVETVSAGGGSVAWVDEGGALRVGPRSAGAVPGPAAFARGGAQPTVTDAHVVLGHVRAARLAGGVTVDAEAARRAIGDVASRLGAAVDRVARAIIATADATMARALRRVSVERGVDPRRCTLVAFGGGGPLHACGLAELLGATQVLVPPHAGVLSALGLAITAERREGMVSLVTRTDECSHDALAAALRRAEEMAGASRAGASHGERERHWWLRARYVGQGHELDVAATPDDAPRAVAARFAEAHRARFGFDLPNAVELVSVRCAIVGRAWPATLAREGQGAPVRWPQDAGALHDDGGPLDARLRGPATVALPDATMLVREGWSARTLPIGGWMLERGS